MDFGKRKIWKEKSTPVFTFDLIRNNGTIYKMVRFYDDKKSGKKYVVKVKNEDHWDVHVSTHNFTEKNFAWFSKESESSLSLYFLMTTVCLSERVPSHYELIEGRQHA